MTLRNILRLTWALSVIAVSSCASTGNPETLGQTIPTPVVVRMLNLDLPAAIFTPTPEPTQPLEPTVQVILLPTRTPANSAAEGSQGGEPPATPACINAAEFIRHLSISDNTALESGQLFAKIWLVKNTGACVWNEAYTLRFFSGDEMSGPDQIQLPHSVNPGETVEIRLNLVAPSGLTNSAGYWVLSDPEGNLFGFGDDRMQPLSVMIQIKPTPKPTPG